MKKISQTHLFTNIIFVVSFLIAMPVNAGWMDFLKENLKNPEVSKAAETVLSNDDIVAGLKEALVKGVDFAVSFLGKKDGFMKNSQVNIPIPDGVKPISDALKKIGQDNLVDEFHLTLNRAAEDAVPEAKALLTKTIQNMSIEDARKILQGNEHAATDYFKQVAGQELHQRILPIVENATSATGVTSSYKNLLSQLGPMASFLGSQVPDLDKYVTDKALDGLYTVIAAEEKKIRENPVERTTDLLKRVFAN